MANNPIANLFGSSPIKPIQKHMAAVADAVFELDALFESAMDCDWQQAEQRHSIILGNMRRADSIVKELRMNMPKGLFMPVSRTDLLTIIDTQHHFAVIALDISSLITERQMQMPKKLHAPLRKLVRTTVQDNQNALNAINELDELLEGGFGGHVTKVLKKLIRQIDQQFIKVEKSAKKTRQQLMKLETEMSSVDVMFLYKVIKQITDIARQSRVIGNYLELLMAK